jgi:hypothetical protein
LNDLHTRVGDQAEIVFGISNDERMLGRAQVILVITGLGAPTLEEVMPGISLNIESISKQKQPPRLEPSPVSSDVIEPAEPIPAGISQAIGSNDLDIPAFLRRRSRTTSPN